MQEYTDITIDISNETINELLTLYVKHSLLDTSISKFNSNLESGMSIPDATIDAILNHMVNIAIRRQMAL